MSGAPRQAIDRAEAALARVDDLGRGHVSAAILVGSAVLGDWREDRSDIDLLLVSDSPLAPAIRGLWRRAARADVIIAETGRPAWGDLGLAVALKTAAQTGHVLRGAAPSAPDDGEFATLLEANLGAYWKPWLDRARGRRLGGPTAAMFTPFGAVWARGGIGRIRSTLADGRIISKREALNCALARLPEYRAVLAEAVRLRDGAAPLMGRLERRRLVLACADALLARRW